jgi:hypothetical protein
MGPIIPPVTFPGRRESSKPLTNRENDHDETHPANRRNERVEAAVDGADVVLHLAGGPKGDDVATRNLVRPRREPGSGTWCTSRSSGRGANAG